MRHWTSFEAKGMGKIMLKKVFIICVLVSAAPMMLACPGLAGADEQTLPKEYLIEPSDVLEVSIYGEKDLIRKLIVRPDGMVSFPLIGDIEVAGRSPRSVKETIEEKIRSYIPVASATVIVASTAGPSRFGWSADKPLGRSTATTTMKLSPAWGSWRRS